MDNNLVMYKETDLDACVAIYSDAFTAPPLNYHWLTKEKSWRYIRDLTKTPGFMGYTYWENGEMIACCLGILDNYFEGTIFCVEELAVLSKYHSQGIGTKVMDLLEKKIAGYGVEAISLQTSRNLPAFNFYLKNGYEEITENVSLLKQLI